MLSNFVKVKQGMGVSGKKPRRHIYGQKFQRRHRPPNQGSNEANRGANEAKPQCLLGALRAAPNGQEVPWH